MAGTLESRQHRFRVEPVERAPNESTVLPATGRSVTSRAKDELSNVPGSQVGTPWQLEEDLVNVNETSLSSAQFAMAARLLHHDDEELEWEAYRGAAEDARAAGHPLGRDSRTPSPTKMEEESSDRSFLSWFTPPRLGTRELAGQATLTRRERARRRWRKMSADHIGLGPRCRCTRRTAAAGRCGCSTCSRRWTRRRTSTGGSRRATLASCRRPAAADDADGSARPDALSGRRRGARHAVRRGDRGARVAELDKFSENDTYAVVCFEGTPRGHALEDQDPPRWHADTPRAFAFPITAPHAPLHVALLEEDEAADFLGKSAMNKTGAAGRALTSLAAAAQATKINAVVEDTPIGRATVRLGALHGRAVYDGWYPLQQTVNTRHVGQHGEVRLRIRVEWKGERRRLLASQPPRPRPTSPSQACGAQDVRRGRLYRARLGERRQIRPRHLQVPRARAATVDVGAQRDERHRQPRDLLRVSHALAAALRLVAARLLASQPDARVLAARRPRLPLTDLPSPPPRRPPRARQARSACRTFLPRHPPPPAAASVHLAPTAAAAATHVPRAGAAGGADDEEEEEDGYISEGPSATPRPSCWRRR